MSGIRLDRRAGQSRSGIRRHPAQRRLLVRRRLASQARGGFARESKFFGDVAKIQIGLHPVWLLKPVTFMNRSGRAVAALAEFSRIVPEEILIVHDELDLLPGQSKMKKGGGHAGHNGLRDIQAQMGSAEFWRLRLGIGHPRTLELNQPVIDFVLHAPRREERQAIDREIERGLAVMADAASGDLTHATKTLHTRTPPSASGQDSAAVVGDAADHVTGRPDPGGRFAVPRLVVEEEVRLEFAQERRLLQAAEKHRLVDLDPQSISVRIARSCAGALRAVHEGGPQAHRSRRLMGGPMQSVQGLQQRLEWPRGKRAGRMIRLVPLECWQTALPEYAFGLVGKQHGVAVERNPDLVRVGLGRLHRRWKHPRRRRTGLQRRTHVLLVGRQEQIGLERLQVGPGRAPRREHAALQAQSAARRAERKTRNPLTGSLRETTTTSTRRSSS
jgi:PTH1 family peptidyl-tRNA hydrolase